MDKIKITNWEKSYPQRPFPSWRRLSGVESANLRARLISCAALQPSTDPLALVKWLEMQSVICEGVDAESTGFDLMDTLFKSGIHPRPQVYLNWHRFDDVDVMEMEQVSHHFEDIWYPGSDDLDVLDDSLEWVLLVLHSGTVKLVRLAQGPKALRL